jgi:hypothetical protein
VLGNPANRNRAIPLTHDQFRYAFANAVSDAETKDLYETSPCRPAALPSATANLNPSTEAKVDTRQSRPRPVADHLRREGRHRQVRARQRRLQAAAGQPGHHRSARLAELHRDASTTSISTPPRTGRPQRRRRLDLMTTRSDSERVVVARPPSL